MEVHLGGFGEAVHGDIADGIGIIMQGIEDEEPLAGEIGLGQELAGRETDIALAGQNHFRAVGLGIMGPFGFFIVIEIIIVDAEENIMAAEDGPVAEDGGGEIL